MAKIKKGEEKQTLQDGLDQIFQDKDGKPTKIRDFLKPEDTWELKKGKSKATIITHDAIKKMADHAGISSNVGYRVMIEPHVNNNYTVVIEATITSNKGTTNELGESNRGNLGNRGRANPVNMAQKRAYDRAVLRHLRIEGLLGEEELPDEEESKKEMDNLTIDEQKAIVPLINEIINAKKISQLTVFKQKMRTKKQAYSEKQLNVLRSLWEKQFAKLQKSF